MIQFSLICGTAGRTAELERMLLSLSEQSFQGFEVLLIDQNVDDRAGRIVAAVSKNPRIRRLTASPGLCRALNLGLRHARGEIIGFPDDDCWYPRNLIAELSALFSATPRWDGITVRTADENGVPSIARWDKRAGRVTKSNLGFRGCSTSVFYRRRVCEKIGNFDESIGAAFSLVNPGSDIDYLHRVIRAGFHVQYHPQLAIGHPQTLPANDQEGRHKRYLYAHGEGSIARKYGVPLWYVGGIVCFPVMRALKHAIFGNSSEASQQWLTFRGRFEGWMRCLPRDSPPRVP